MLVACDEFGDLVGRSLSFVPRRQTPLTVVRSDCTPSRPSEGQRQEPGRWCTHVSACSPKPSSQADTLRPRPYERLASGDREHDLTLDVPAGGSFVCLPGIRERKRAVEGDTKRARVEQASEFCELRAV